MPKVTILTDNKILEAEIGTTLIDMLENEDTAILFGCRDGASGSCICKIIEGPENLSGMQDDERDFLETMAAESNERLLCQCKVVGDVVLEVSE
tara:strand:- start:165 stop:446 length:282 start_codon:yes stop_codon:yes gene_type:complete